MECRFTNKPRFRTLLIIGVARDRVLTQWFWAKKEEQKRCAIGAYKTVRDYCAPFAVTMLFAKSICQTEREGIGLYSQLFNYQYLHFLIVSLSCTLVADFYRIFFKISHNISYARNCICVNFSKNLKSPLYKSLLSLRKSSHTTSVSKNLECLAPFPGWKSSYRDFLSLKYHLVIFAKLEMF